MNIRKTKMAGKSLRLLTRTVSAYFISALTIVSENPRSNTNEKCAWISIKNIVINTIYSLLALQLNDKNFTFYHTTHFQLIFNFLYLSPVGFLTKTDMLTVMFNINSSSRCQEYSKLLSSLMSQFMLVMSLQFTITLEQRFQGSTNRSGSWQLENNHELQIIADFIVII